MWTGGSLVFYDGRSFLSAKEGISFTFVTVIIILRKMPNSNFGLAGFMTGYVYEKFTYTINCRPCQKRT